MERKSTPQPGEKDVGRDLAAFERLPEGKKDLLKLKDQEEKTTGPEQVAISRKIAARAGETAGNLKAQRFAATGRTTRVQGHVSARNRRTQGKRDSR